MSFKRDLRIFARTMFGLANALVASWFLYIELTQKESHTLHVEIMAAWVLFGLATMWPSVVFGTAKQIIVLLPDVKFGGLRKTDPPKDAP